MMTPAETAQRHKCPHQCSHDTFEDMRHGPTSYGVSNTGVASIHALLNVATPDGREMRARAIPEATRSQEQPPAPVTAKLGESAGLLTGVAR